MNVATAQRSRAVLEGRNRSVEVLREFEQLICPLIDLASTRTALLKRFQTLLSQTSPQQVLPLKEVLKDSPGPQVWS